MKTGELLAAEIGCDEDPDPLLEAAAEFEQTARLLDLEPWAVSRLRHTEREITVSLPLTRDNGEESILTGMRVQHHSGVGPTLGPVHLARDSGLHDLRAAAMMMTWQNALLELPFGGAAGAVVCAPEEHSERELKAIVAAYTRALGTSIGPENDVLMPGPGANEEIMAWMLSGLHPEAPGNGGDPRRLASVLGKPVTLWGLPDAAQAGAEGLRCLLESRFGRLEGMRLCLQGFGTRGRRIAEILGAAGMRLVGVADTSGGLLCSQGIDVRVLGTHIERHGVVYGFASADAVRNADVLGADCDALVLAAAPRQITAANAARLRTPVVVEVAAGAVARSAEAVLSARDVLLIPPILANAGANVAAYVEWKHNLQVAQAPRDWRGEVQSRLQRAFEQVKQYAGKKDVNLRRAALALAAARVSEQMRLSA